MTATLLDHYRLRISREGLRADPAQEAAVRALEELRRALKTAAARPRLRWPWRRRSGPPRGVYLWGSVGRGKTFVMDLFFEHLPLEQKLRSHFHRFMLGVHEELGALREVPAPLESVAERLAARTRVICFDEFFVSDIADAMILGNLFDALFRRGVALVATSNCAPEALYRDGLQRQRFLPAIELLRRHTRVLHMDGGRDYRLAVLERAPLYQTPLGPAAEQALRSCFADIAPDEPQWRAMLTLCGRPVETLAVADGVAWFDFQALCGGPRSHADYVELARSFHSVAVSNVPVLDRLSENEARRFIALVDEFYDRRVKLIVSAAAPPASLYQGRRLRFEWRRTCSRLLEMQTHRYLTEAHRA